MMLMMFLVWALVLALTVWGVSVLFPSHREHRTGEAGRSAAEILARRYARGDISRQEYEAMSKDLEPSAAEHI